MKPALAMSRTLSRSISSETFLLMARRSRSFPASGAMASDFSPCRARIARSSSESASILIDERAMWNPSPERPFRIGRISGWSATAVAMRPTREVSGRQRSATARMLEAGIRTCGAIA